MDRPSFRGTLMPARKQYEISSALSLATWTVLGASPFYPSASGGWDFGATTSPN